MIRVCRHSRVVLCLFHLNHLNRMTVLSSIKVSDVSIAFMTDPFIVHSLQDREISRIIDRSREWAYVFQFLTDRQQWVALYFMVSAFVDTSDKILWMLNKYDIPGPDLRYIYNCCNRLHIANQQANCQVFSSHPKVVLARGGTPKYSIWG